MPKVILVVDDDVQVLKSLERLLRKDDHDTICATSKNKPDIPVVFLTGYSDMVAIDRAKQYGEVILKPFNLDELLGRVKQKTA